MLRRLFLTCSLLATSTALLAQQAEQPETDPGAERRARLVRQLQLNQSYVRHYAKRSLIWHYMARQNYRAAQDVLEKWATLPCTCGLIWEAHEEQRHELLFRCRLQQGEHVQVAEELLGYMRQQYLPSSYSPILFQLYHEAGQEEDLIALIRNAKMENFHNVPHLLQLQQLRREHDYPALIKLCQRGNGHGDEQEYHNHNWLLTAKALAECLEPDASPLLKVIDTCPNNRNLLIYALGLHRSPAALRWLTRSDVEPGELRELTYALSLHGADGKQALETFAQQKTPLAAAARDRLIKLADPDPWDQAWPKPKPGSLPRP